MKSHYVPNVPEKHPLTSLPPLTPVFMTIDCHPSNHGTTKPKTKPQKNGEKYLNHRNAVDSTVIVKAVLSSGTDVWLVKSWCLCLSKKQRAVCTCWFTGQTALASVRRKCWGAEGRFRWKAVCVWVWLFSWWWLRPGTGWEPGFPSLRALLALFPLYVKATICHQSVISSLHILVQTLWFPSNTGATLPSPILIWPCKGLWRQ